MHARTSLPQRVFAGALCLVVAAGFVYAWSPHLVRARAEPTAVVMRARPAASARARPAVSAAGQWAKAWSADFRGPAGSGVDRAQWAYQTGTGKFGNGSVETMTGSPRNVYLNGRGELDITALREGAAWTSGRVMSAVAFTPPRGGEMMVTASVREPSPRGGGGVGYWPAFWMLGEGSWPAHGEIDIVEDVNDLGGHSGAFHCGNLVQPNADGTLGPCHEHTGRSSGLLACGRCQAGFHAYRVIVDLRDRRNGQIRWYLDGREFFAVQESEVGAATWDTAVDHGFRIVIDLAMGGSYPDEVCRCVAPDASTASGGTLRIRDVAVYQRL